MDFVKDLAPLWKEVGSIIGLVAVGILGYLIPLITKRFKAAIQQKFFMISLKNSIDLKINMAEVKAKFDADRIYLYQFHNGKVYVGDVNFHKYSCSAIFELVNPGFSLELKNQQSMHLDVFEDVLHFMFEKNKDAVIVGSTEGSDLKLHRVPALHEMSVTMNGKSMVALKIKNKLGAFVGLLVMWFPGEMTREKFVQECKFHTELGQLLKNIKDNM